VIYAQIQCGGHGGFTQVTAQRGQTQGLIQQYGKRATVQRTGFGIAYERILKREF